jgi:hypothetical protein
MQALWELLANFISVATKRLLEAAVRPYGKL